MRAIPELPNDQLWLLDFGEGRDKNLLYVVEPSAPAGGPSLNAVVSLLNDGNTEVRLFRSAPKVDGGPAPVQDGEVRFGVFAPLRRDREACKF